MDASRIRAAARGSRSRAAFLVAAALAAGCASRPPAGPVPVVRRGPGRANVPYAGGFSDAKAAVLARVNADRAAAGLPHVAVDAVAEKAADAFCRDAARTKVMGHWDLAGRAPYDRYADAGGVDVLGENFSGVSRRGNPFHAGELVGLALEAHGRMMAERPPDDGHRRTVLDPQWTHVGIGLALEGGEFRMTEEFTRHVLPWVEVPAAPVDARRGSAPFAAGLPKGWTLVALEIAHERAPRPMSAAEIRRRASYAYPEGGKRLLPRLAAPHRYADGSVGDLDVSGGAVRAEIPFFAGAGSYWVFVYAAPGPVPAGRTLAPAAAARIVAAR